MSSPPPLRIVLVGWGAIGQAVAEMLAAHREARGGAIEVVGVAIRDACIARPNLPSGATLISDPAQLAALAPDLVAEAAGRESVAPWGRAALAARADLIVSSGSAFADANLLNELRALAVTNGRQIHLQPGALGGVDALAGAALMGIDAVEHRIVKPPRAWAGTPAETSRDLEAMTEAVVIFTGTASDAASSYPKNANVAMTSALAGVGPDATTVTMVADPAASANRHEIRAHGAFGQLDATIANAPLPSNPKTSAMAALNLARTILNRAAPFVV